jgi:hypothetical protein
MAATGRLQSCPQTQPKVTKTHMSDETNIEDVFAQHERRSAHKMKIIVGMFAAVILVIFLIIVVG